VFSSNVNIMLEINFHYSHLNSKISIYNKLNYYCNFRFFFFFFCVEILKSNYHKRKQMVQMKNLSKEFEIPFILYVILINLFSCLLKN
jgi:hypothetical protein